MATINGKQYEWADIDIVVGGMHVSTQQAISYKRAIEKTAIYGKGRQPIAIQKGNASYEGKISLLQGELEAMEIAATAAGSDLLEISFDIVVGYIDDATVSYDYIRGAQFTEYEKGMSQGDANMVIELPFTALGIGKK
ncbi:MAG: hypothetical protein LBN95_07020 [Prevotellaceae bacterium]|jgi:hypothetical protein|nr:hypothetical protein [Prevotellaceae bacterium]